DAATFHPSCREPRNPRARIRRRRTGSRAENPHTNRADHPRPQIRYASPSTATATQGPTGKDRCLASPHNKLDPNRSLPKPTQKTALPTPFSEEPGTFLLCLDRQISIGNFRRRLRPSAAAI